MRYRAALALVLFAFARLGVAATISFVSDPPGATVCKKLLEREECFHGTPLQIDLEATATSSQRFLVRKLGYQTRSVLVEPTSAEIAVKLVKQDLFRAPQVHDDIKLRELQRTVNERLARVIYEDRAGREADFELVGQRGMVRAEGTVQLVFPLLVNSYQALRKLRRAGRMRDAEKRHAAAFEAFAWAGIFDFFDDVARALAPLPVDRIVFKVLYAKSVAVLDFDQVQMLGQRYTGSYYNSIGGTTQRIDTYEVFTTTQDVTVVKDQNVAIDYVFSLDLNLVRGGRLRTLDLLPRMDIHTNDSRGGRYQKVSVPKPGER
jgi:hypothetical protein